MFDQLDVAKATVKETTLKTSVTFEGVGLHCGELVTMTIHPATSGTGILYRRLDLLDTVIATGKSANQAEALAHISVKAHPAAVTSTQLGTTMTNAHGVTISTVEHLMAAFAGLGIDHAIVEVDNVELPIMDGSSQPFVERIEQIGLRHLNTARKSIRITQKIAVEDGDRWAYIMPTNDYADACDMSVIIAYEAEAIGQQSAHFRVSPEVFRDEVAAARTFCNLSDVEYMRAQGKALGGSEANAIVVDGDEVLNEGGLRFTSEFAYHKALDLLGDLYLLGAPIIGKVSAFKPGHDLNTKLARAVLESGSYELVETAEVVDETVRVLA